MNKEWSVKENDTASEKCGSFTLFVEKTENVEFVWCFMLGGFSCSRKWRENWKSDRIKTISSVVDWELLKSTHSMFPLPYRLRYFGEITMYFYKIPMIGAVSSLAEVEGWAAEWSIERNCCTDGMCVCPSVHQLRGLKAGRRFSWAGPTPRLEQSHRLQSDSSSPPAWTCVDCSIFHPCY